MNRRLNRHSLAADAILRATEIFTNFHPLNRDYDNNKLKFSIVELMELFKILIETNEISSNKCFSVSLNLGAVLLLAIVLAK